jgi:pyruvate formate lyase activating enzyme
VENPQFFPEIKEEEVLQYLKERKGLIDAVCITGGEPLLWKEELLPFLIKVKEQGFKVKVDTNGVTTLPF